MFDDIFTISEKRLRIKAEQLVDRFDGLNVHAVIFSRLVVNCITEFKPLVDFMIKLMYENTSYADRRSNAQDSNIRDFDVQEVIDLVTLMVDLAPMILGHRIRLDMLEKLLFYEIRS